jgi:hypothetical protein
MLSLTSTGISYEKMTVRQAASLLQTLAASRHLMASSASTLTMIGGLLRLGRGAQHVSLTSFWLIPF